MTGTTTRPEKRSVMAAPRIAAAFAVLLVSLVGGLAQPAAAVPSGCGGGLKSTSDWYNGGHQAIFRAYGYNCNNGLDWWDGFRTQETAPAWDTICATQSYLNGNTPAYGTLYSQYSSYMSGCTWQIKFYDWPGWDQSYYPGDIYFGGWWLSDSTPGGGWDEIGILRA